MYQSKQVISHIDPPVAVTFLKFELILTYYYTSRSTLAYTMAKTEKSKIVS